MKKLRSILVLFLLFSTMFMVNENVDASAGRLQSASITYCNGVMYGKHTNHWHRAVKRGKYYYPNGSPVSKPCGKKKKKKSTPNTYYNRSSSSSNKSNITYSSGSNKATHKAVIKNDVTDQNKSNEDQIDNEKDNIYNEVDTQNEENTTPEVSNFDGAYVNSDEKNKEKGTSGNDIFASAMVGFVFGAGGSYFVGRKLNKKKKDDLTNW